MFDVCVNLTFYCGWIVTGDWEVGPGHLGSLIDGDVGLIVKRAAKHHAIVTVLPKPVNPAEHDLVFQYVLRIFKFSFPLFSYRPIYGLSPITHPPTKSDMKFVFIKIMRAAVLILSC